jgi:2-polyprenyl-3-methyl-5-hydroxy-6-metoxy-1,4-benzoquinol methylase
LSGGGYSERLLIKLLLRVYRSNFRLQWLLSEHKPHFEDQRIDISYFAFGEDVIGPYSFYRGFFSSEVIRAGDALLDIGCGDGFFTRRFFAEKCARIDAIDLETSAINAAKLNNTAPNINTDPFPQEEYDVIVWDGAIAHFPNEALEVVLQKIRQSLSHDGVFVGSESLGLEESADHLQYFLSLDELGSVFKPYFKYIELRTVDYKIIHGDYVRKEAYWRCTNDAVRLADCHWKKFRT